MLSTGNAALRVAVETALESGAVPPRTYEHPVAYNRTDWQQARKAAKDTGVALDAVRLQRTWAHRTAHSGADLAALVDRGITDAALDAVARTHVSMTRTKLELAR